MRVNKAKRRWIRWCRYVDATGSQAAQRGGIHRGQAKAFKDAMYAHRWAPKGVRLVPVPKRGSRPL
ncbi:MAG TPA: hypothetical protein VFG99_09515 [Chloroflexia bacterium]|nr:hypothetical protein [Chloroflexia bacterium]